MILIITAPTDPHADLVESKLRARGADVFRFDPADFPERASVAVRYGAGAKQVRLEVGGRTVELTRATAAWLRRPGAPPADQRIADPMLRSYAQQECFQLFQDIWNALETPFIPGPLWAIRRADSKHLQLQLAVEIGLDIPQTLITTSPAQFLAFHRENGGHLIDKMPSPLFPLERNGPVHRYTQAVTTRDVGYASRLRKSPVLFQPNVPKALELRVTVVGDQVLAAEIHSQATEHTRQDWRRYDHAHTPHHVHALPAEVSERCVRLVRRLGLCFGAIDFILTPEGRYVFLEINPNGQWLWIEQMTGLPISDAICDALMAPRSEDGAV